MSIKEDPKGEGLRIGVFGVMEFILPPTFTQLLQSLPERFLLLLLLLSF